MIVARQFGLRSLFLVIAVFATGLWMSLRVHGWWVSKPLADAIEAYNSRIQNDPVRGGETQLTEDEVVNSIRSQLAGFPASPAVKAIYAQIVRKRRVPRDAIISPVKSYSVTPEGIRWQSILQLDVVTRDKKHCSFPIRVSDASIQPVLVGKEGSSSAR